MTSLLSKRNFYYLMIILITLSFNPISLTYSGETQQFYSWKDENGVTHVTDDPEKIPPKYRENIKKYESISNKKYSFKKLKLFLTNNKKKITYAVSVIAVSILIFFLFQKFSRYIRAKHYKYKRTIEDKNIERSKIETLTEEKLKLKAREILIKEGYKIIEPESIYSTVVDLIGSKGSEKTAISINLGENLISKMVINEIDREKHKYNCSKSMVVARTYFDEDAWELAKKINCRLIDKRELAKLILKKTKY